MEEDKLDKLIFEIQKLRMATEEIAEALGGLEFARLRSAIETISETVDNENPEYTFIRVNRGG